MAEDQGNKDEEKLEFTSEGEALGYIGMDQAQVRAMQIAAETPGDYGTAYAGIAMAFEVADAQETDDHYIITLSLRPQGEFDGRVGLEQFFDRERRERRSPPGACSTQASPSDPTNSRGCGSSLGCGNSDWRVNRCNQRSWG